MNIFPTLYTHKTCPAHITLTTQYMATDNLLQIIKLFITPVYPPRVVILCMHVFIYLRSFCCYAFSMPSRLYVCMHVRTYVYVYVYI